MAIKPPAKVEEVEEEESIREEKRIIPDFGTLEWIHYLSEIEGHLPTPINVSITGATMYNCPDLQWFNFDIFPHKVKITNTGFTVVLGAKWKAERPFLLGGPLVEKHILSEIHFHWGSNMSEGSDHMVDNQKHPGEMQVTFFKMDYMTQEEAFKHPDGVIMMCYLIRYGVFPDDRLKWVLEGFPRIKEPNTFTRVGPQPMSKLMPLFFEDYFLYWGTLQTASGDDYVCRWIVPRCCLHATIEQMDEFRRLWNPWDEPNVRNYRLLQEVDDRHILFIRAHWSQYNTLLKCDYLHTQFNETEVSECYIKNPKLLPPGNAYMLPPEEEEEVKEVKKLSPISSLDELLMSQS